MTDQVAEERIAALEERVARLEADRSHARSLFRLVAALFDEEALRLGELEES